jgi:small-conductance mechanosensitive channel
MTEDLQDFLQQTYFGNTYLAYLIALFTFIAVIIGGWIFKKIILNILKSYSKKTETHFDDLLLNIVGTFGPVFYIVIGFNLAAKNLNITETGWFFINGLTVLILSFYIVSRLQQGTSYLIRKIVDKKSEEGEKFDASLANLLSFFINVALWTFTIIFILQNFNINVSGLIGGLGITGIAVAFALQNVLSDIFASFSIYLDRPFKLGDFIIIGEGMGTVEKIGMKSTRIKSLSGELLVVSNKELSDIRIRNFRSIEKRRRQFNIGVEYSTSNEKMKKATDLIKEIIESLEICDFERAVFESFGDFSLNLLISYYVKTPDHDTFMQINQKINLEIKEAFEKEGIKFAFPTQRILLPNKR